MPVIAEPRTAPRLDHLYSADVSLGEPVHLGTTAQGYRLIVPILGGTLEGPSIRATIRSGGSDWIIVRPDGVSELDIRTMAETDDGALIYVTIRGYLTNQAEIVERVMRGEAVSTDDYYFGLAPVYETSDPRYAWLQSILVVGMAQFHGARVTYEAYTVR